MTSIAFLDQSPPSTEGGGTSPANWAPHTLDAWSTIRQLHDDIADLRHGLHAAVAIIAERDRTIVRRDDAIVHLRAQLRAAVREAQQQREYLAWLDSLYHEGPNQPARVSDAL